MILTRVSVAVRIAPRTFRAGALPKQSRETKAYVEIECVHHRHVIFGGHDTPEVVCRQLHSGVLTLRKLWMVSSCALTKMFVEFIMTSEAWVIRTIAAHA